MDEAVLFPSPNWFLVSNFAVSKDGWMVYGGPSKGICVLEPRNDGNGVITGNNTYRAHAAPRVHSERVVSVDISPEFEENRNFISGSQDGTVKQLTLEKVQNVYQKIKTTHNHEIHFNEKEEIVGVGYSTNTIAISVGCLGNVVKWDLTSNVCRKYSKYLSKFKPTCMSCSPHLPYHVAIGTKQGVVFILDLQSDLGKIVYKIRSQDDEITSMSWCPQYEVLLNKSLSEPQKKSTATRRMEAIRNSVTEADKENVFEQSGVIKNLPEDSFDESVVEEDDTFDIYKDHEADEFGHKKYEPEDIFVKVKQEKSDESDYLAECLKLKQEILNRKNETETSIESLVVAMDKTHVDKAIHQESSETEATGTIKKEKKESRDVHSVHPHKHLLATIGRFGTVRVWSKSGKLVSSCTLVFNAKTPRNKVMSWPTLLWYRPDSLLLVDSKSQLMECNPLLIDSKNKLKHRVVHAHHRRGLYAILTDAPKVQTAYNSPESPYYQESNKWSVYTVSQDRNIIRYNMHSKKKVVHNTCGGFLYTIQCCPYDAGKIAISVGDGAIRVWQTMTTTEDENKLYPGKVKTYWQNVQGKVLTLAWHPTKENLLAFGTGECRVGLLDIGGKGEKPAQVLYPALTRGVYSLCWAEGMTLYACGGPSLFMYNAANENEVPKEVDITVEGQKWQVDAVTWTPRGLVVGASSGAVAVLHVHTHEVLAVSYAFNKQVHMLEWHPQQTSNSSEESPYKNLIAVTSAEKHCQIIILEYNDTEEGKKELIVWKKLVGHKLQVLQINWNPHHDHLLLSTCQDGTIRVWDVTSGTCISIFGGHCQHTIGGTWLAMPQLDTKVLSGGSDCCLRLWDYKDFKPEHFERIKHDAMLKIKKGGKKKEDEVVVIEEEQDAEINTEAVRAINTDYVRRPSKKFLFPITHKQMNPGNFVGLKKMYEKYVERKEDDSGDVTPYDCDFIKIFGTINEVNEVLDMEMASLLADEIYEGWLTLAMFRGQIDTMIELAKQKDLLCPYLLNMTPCVSFKFWKESTQAYVMQINRCIAKGAEEKLIDNKYFGGAVYRKMTALLSMHDIKGAVATLTDAKLFKEAYILCRLRYMDSIAEQTLKAWATSNYFSGNMRGSAICHMALGNLSEAATVLAKFHDQETLSLAADIAKMAGRNNFADHVEQKALTSAPQKSEKTEELLQDLPSRIELLMKNLVQSSGEVVENNEDVESDEDVESEEENVQSNDKNGDIK